eukprot:6164464-Pleurochrysis_carterae.AAC.1
MAAMLLSDMRPSALASRDATSVALQNRFSARAAVSLTPVELPMRARCSPPPPPPSPSPPPLPPTPPPPRAMRASSASAVSRLHARLIERAR